MDNDVTLITSLSHDYSQSLGSNMTRNNLHRFVFTTSYLGPDHSLRSCVILKSWLRPFVPFVTICGIMWLFVLKLSILFIIFH